MSFFIPFEFHKDDRLDGMTVIDPIARGGNGDLYMIRDEQGYRLALKIIRKTDNDDERSGISRCQAVSSHIPGLAPVLKTGKLSDGRVYCVMPLADNLARWPDYEPDTLANRIRRDGRIPPDKVLDLAGGIAETVRALHESGLAHCDIKPENILFLDGKPMLSDYSLLSDTADHQAGSRTGAFGTADFVPPEMIENPGYYNPKACDVYALGKIIYCAWSGMEVMFFPSVPQDVPLREIGIMRPLYMKACDIIPSRRFQNADELIPAIEDARARLGRGVNTSFPGCSWKKKPVLFSALLIILCAIGIVNLFYLLKIQSGKAPDQEKASDAGTASTFISDGGNGGKTLPPDPLVITTDSDVVDENDGAISLREAIEYAQSLGGGMTVSFSKDCTIRLASPLPVSRDMTIDGGSNAVAVIGPETAPMFQVANSGLTLKNLSLISDRTGDGGGILDAGSEGEVFLVSVKDGGKARLLWSFSGIRNARLDNGCHLHRARVVPPDSGNAANIRIGAGCVLEDSCVSGASERWQGGSLGAFGELKNVSAADNGDIYLVQGGDACENLTVQNGGLIVHRPGSGAIRGLKIEFGGVYAYQRDVLLTGTLSIGGAVCTPLGMAAENPIVGEETDLVFDLTERTGDSKFGFDCMADNLIYSISDSNPSPLVDNMNAFSGAHSYAVRVKPDQAAGTYKLAGKADGFASPLSLAVGDTLYPDALTVGNSFSIENTIYSLSLDRDNALALSLTIAAPQPRTAFNDTEQNFD